MKINNIEFKSVGSTLPKGRITLPKPPEAKPLITVENIKKLSKEESKKGLMAIFLF